jgi:thioredoxin-like negative regulator of GroEL
MIEETKNHFISDSDIKHVISDTERLVIILFVTDGNAYSILMESGLRNLPVEIKKQIHWYLINQDQNKASFELYNIRSIPSLLIFKKKQLIDVITGVISEEELIDKIEQKLK